MELAAYLVVALCVGAAVAGAVARTWSLHSRLYSLEDRVGVIEGTVQREVKIRAAQERWSKPPKNDTLFAQAPVDISPVKKGPWWKNPKLKTGTYAS